MLRCALALRCPVTVARCYNVAVYLFFFLFLFSHISYLAQEPTAELAKLQSQSFPTTPMSNFVTLIITMHSLLCAL